MTHMWDIDFQTTHWRRTYLAIGKDSVSIYLFIDVIEIVKLFIVVIRNILNIIYIYIRIFKFDFKIGILEKHIQMGVGNFRKKEILYLKKHFKQLVCLSTQINK